MSTNQDKQTPVCPNCGQWQHNTREHASVGLYLDCVNQCAERGFAPKVKAHVIEHKQADFGAPAHESSPVVKGKIGAPVSVGERTQENAHLLHEHGLRPLPRTDHEQRTQHTPGPWTSNLDGQIQCEHINQYGNFIVAVIGREMTAEDHANARLIAAAPELLAACKRLLASNTAVIPIAIENVMRDAIAEAEGSK